MVAGLNAAGKEIIGQSTQEDGAQIRLQLNTLNTRWVNITQEIAERKRRCVCVLVSAVPVCMSAVPVCMSAVLTIP
jgi:chorismate synthase